MASITMTASFLGSVNASERPSTTSRRRLVVAKAAATSQGEEVKLNCNKENKKESNNGRRDLMFAAAAATMSSIVGVAMAVEPKSGTPEAKKKYAPVCVTMPTARICHK
ncbi:hypothetical protein HHK36_011906 [Tetracentron sinense]|uniref:Photosystem II 5 kDa protein, chloroplastic n=1 Tax=Tetracentron sinense TaxID=13715 RepID=A0A834ZDZ4_TETSI|nr:hypothetical protein HHK36_011906 [Tetracentron sinense]